MENRKKAEAEFHDLRELDRKNMSEVEFNRKYTNLKIYDTVEASVAYIENWLKENCTKGKFVLDYCCGTGKNSLKVSEYGATVYGIDISEESILASKTLLNGAGYSSCATFQVMDAENLIFEENMFDVIICSGVLHHLDVNLAYPQLSRVLKPSGKIICIEALGYNPAINLYRRLTPKLRTEWEVDHILTLSELKCAKKFFNNVKVDFFHFFSIGGVFFRNYFFFKGLMKFLNFLDMMVLKIPYFNLMAWQMVFILSNPKKK